jgi:hypothetical protein
MLEKTLSEVGSRDQEALQQLVVVAFRRNIAVTKYRSGQIKTPRDVDFNGDEMLQVISFSAKVKGMSLEDLKDLMLSLEKEWLARELLS